MPVAIITGADSGIGRATAVKLAEQGWDVGITWYGDEEPRSTSMRRCAAPPPMSPPSTAWAG